MLSNKNPESTNLINCVSLNFSKKFVENASHGRISCRKFELLLYPDHIPIFTLQQGKFHAFHVVNLLCIKSSKY